MKIFWLTNLRLPVVDELIGEKSNYYGGGWLTGLLGEILKDEGNRLLLCYPEYETKSIVTGLKDNISFYGIPIDARRCRLGTLRIESVCNTFIQIIEKEKPDVLHIHGTEFPYSNALIKAAEKIGYLNKSVISIQGMVSVYANHFYGNLPRNVRIKRTLKEMLIKDGVNDRYKSFLRRGELERETITIAKNVMGRTSWDYINTVSINPDIRYFQSNETLRSSFYTGEWKYDACNFHSIFVSQAGTVLKSFHIVLDAVQIIKGFYPDVKIRVSGPDITQGNKLNGNSYGQYIKRKITNMDLNDVVCFLGSLDAERMKEEMLKANVFVLPSSIENSPNSLGEAMLLGVPCVSSDVGGVSDMMKHGIEGYIYPADAPDMLAYYIKKVFDSGEQASALGKNARIHAQQTHDPLVNSKRVMEIYEELVK